MLGDEFFHALIGAGVHDDALELVHVGIGVAQARAEPGGGCGVVGAERVVDQCGALAGTQIVAGRLARDCRVAEHSQLVIAELESHADIVADASEQIDGLPIGADQGCADVQGARDRVGGRLVRDDRHGIGHILAAVGLHGDIKDLSGDDFGAHGAPCRAGALKSGGGQAGAVEHVICPGKREVAAEDGLRYAVVFGGPVPGILPVLGLEGPVRGGVAAPGVGGVDDVIVDEGAGLDEL